MSPGNPPDEEAVPLSVLLRTLPDLGATTVNLGEIIAHFGPRAFGALLFVFAVILYLIVRPRETMAEVQ